jgi:hypothetical protein
MADVTVTIKEIFMNILTVTDHKRGCGWRKEGGLYLVSGGLSAPCGKLPIPLCLCPTCGMGIKPSRGWTWVDGTTLLKDKICSFVDTLHCDLCPLDKDPGIVGLLWIGEKYYPTTDDFTTEAAQLGVSRRINAVPNEFTLGKTWVWFAHRKGMLSTKGDRYQPAVFHAFKPTRIEYIVTGNETDEQLDRLVKRGITPIRFIRAGETPDFPII